MASDLFRLAKWQRRQGGKGEEGVEGAMEVVHTGISDQQELDQVIVILCPGPVIRHW